jgi:hypothetical protein
MGRRVSAITAIKFPIPVFPVGSVQGDTHETDGHENGMPIILFRREIPLRPRAMETKIISSASNNPIRYGRTAFT